MFQQVTPSHSFKQYREGENHEGKINRFFGSCGAGPDNSGSKCPGCDLSFALLEVGCISISAYPVCNTDRICHWIYCF